KLLPSRFAAISSTIVRSIASQRNASPPLRGRPMLSSPLMQRPSSLFAFGGLASVVALVSALAACDKSDSATPPAATQATASAVPVASSPPAASAVTATASAAASASSVPADSAATAKASPPADAKKDGGGAAPAGSSAAAECGTKPQPDCPLQAWMKVNV